MTIDLDELSKAKKSLSPLLDDCTFEEAEHGESNARVLRVLMPDGDAAYLKYGFGVSAEEIRHEHERLVWLRYQARAPRVLSYASGFDASFLLTEALSGRTGDDASSADPATIVKGMAQALRELHSIPPQECPFDESLSVRLRRAAIRMEAGLVDEEDFDLPRQGARVTDLYQQLVRQAPGTGQLVVAHGDACPENFIFLGDAFVGLLDCGRVGLADKYQDLALASRNIGAVYGRELADLFFVAYGEPNPDLDKIEYYRILDEFF